MKSNSYPIFWDDELWLRRQNELQEQSVQEIEKPSTETGVEPHAAASPNPDTEGISGLETSLETIFNPMIWPANRLDTTSDLLEENPLNPLPKQTTDDSFRASEPNTRASWPAAFSGEGTDNSLQEEVVTDNNPNPLPAKQAVTRQEIQEIVDGRLAELRVYVLESDITEAQLAVKSVVEQASF